MASYQTLDLTSLEVLPASQFRKVKRESNSPAEKGWVDTVYHLDDIRRDMAQPANRRPNLGIICGDGLVDVDIDCRVEGRNANGHPKAVENLIELFRECGIDIDLSNGRVPPTTCWKSYHDGSYHLLFTKPVDESIKTVPEAWKGHGFTFKSGSHLAVVPPSRRRQGTKSGYYTWHPKGRIAPQPLPEKVLELLRRGTSDGMASTEAVSREYSNLEYPVLLKLFQTICDGIDPVILRENAVANGVQWRTPIRIRLIHSGLSAQDAVDCHWRLVSRDDNWQTGSDYSADPSKFESRQAYEASRIVNTDGTLQYRPSAAGQYQSRGVFVANSQSNWEVVRNAEIEAGLADPEVKPASLPEWYRHALIPLLKRAGYDVRWDLEMNFVSVNGMRLQTHIMQDIVSLLDSVRVKGKPVIVTADNADSQATVSKFKKWIHIGSESDVANLRIRPREDYLKRCYAEYKDGIIAGRYDVMKSWLGELYEFENDALVEWSSMAPLVAAVHGIVNPVYIHSDDTNPDTNADADPTWHQRAMPVLWSRQKHAKSAVIAALVPNKAWTGTMQLGKAADVVGASRGKVLVEFAEVEGFNNKHRRGENKATLSDATKTARIPYAALYDDYSMAFGRIATGNMAEEAYLPRHDEMTRLVSLVITGMKMDEPYKWVAKHRDILWALAYHLYMEGYSIDTPKDLAEECYRSNIPFRERNPAHIDAAATVVSDARSYGQSLVGKRAGTLYALMGQVLSNNIYNTGKKLLVGEAVEALEQVGVFFDRSSVVVKRHTDKLKWVVVEEPTEEDTEVDYSQTEEYKQLAGALGRID